MILTRLCGVHRPVSRNLEYSEAVAVAVATTQPGTAHTTPTGRKIATAVVRLLMLYHL